MTKLRLRTPGKLPLSRVAVSGKAWTEFRAQEETVIIPAGLAGRVEVVAQY